MSTDDLAAFIAARYDEAEALARAAAQASRPGWKAREDIAGTWVKPKPAGSGAVAETFEPREQGVPVAAFIAVNDPAHRLADIRLKRAILALHEHWHEGRSTACCTCHKDHESGDPVPGWCTTVRQLGTEFAEHPGYRESWKP